MGHTVDKSGTTSQAAGSFTSGNVSGILSRILELVEGLGEGFLTDQGRVRGLRERLAEERFHLAVLGQFKRGKSTLLNAFLGESLLPTSVVPLTSIPTFLFPGPKRVVRVLFLDGRSEEFSDLSCDRAADILANYVTEERNPKNKLGVFTVEVEHPSRILSKGVVMIDTPGIGSTFRHNTDATLNFLPQCDAALFMVSTDPPITAVEVEFLKAVRTKVARLFFVMNKVDYLGDDERNHAVEFFRVVIQEQVGFDGKEPIFAVSARQALQGRLTEDPVLWEKSGVEPLQAHLLDFLAREKSRTLQIALAHKARDTVDDMTMRIRLQCRSLQMPLEDLENRIQMFEKKILEVERERITLGDLLNGDRKRTLDFLETQAEKSRQTARRRLEAVASEALRKAEEPRVMEQRLQERLAEEVPAFFEGELGSLSDAMDRRIQEILQPYQNRAGNLMDFIRRAAAELFDIPRQVPHSVGILEERHKPYWVTHNWSTSIGALPEGFVDSILPVKVRRRRVMKRLAEDIETLVVHNVENIRWATLRNLDDVFRRFASVLDDRLRETVEAMRGTIHSAHVRRKEKAETVKAEIQRLKRMEAELVMIEKELSEFADSRSNTD